MTILFVSSLTFHNKIAWAQDITPPITTVTQTPSTPDGDNGWYVSPILFELEATDIESGVSQIWYRIDSGTWNTVSFSDTLNLIQNPSFETAGATTSGLENWEATVVDPEGTYSQSTTNYAPNFSTASAQIISTGGLWHGINNYNDFAVTSAYQNMSATAWIKTNNATGGASFKIYGIAPNGLGGETIQQIAQSSIITGTTDWTRVSLNFTVTLADATGVYIDLGIEGPGTVWFDAITLDSSTSAASTSFTVASDSENHRVEFYSVDQAGNTETYLCPSVNCINFKLDSTSPGNWNGSGATRGLFGPSHELYVYTNVEDATSGLSVFTDKYQYKTDNNVTFGRYSNILNCGSTWQPGNWVILITPPFSPGTNSAFLLTPKTDFCNSNWKICKTVRFYAEDLAGNTAAKDFCLNGPWIRLRGEAAVRSNSYIDMLAEANGDNTDGLLEVVQTNIDFFTSSKNWEVTNTETFTEWNYSDFWDAVTTNKTEITGSLVANTGVYYVNGDYEIKNSAVPNNFDSNTFDQILFVDGNLTVTADIDIADESTFLIITSGDVQINKNVSLIDAAIMTDGDMYTAFDVTEGEALGALAFQGLYKADEFFFQRTLQGTNNQDDPSEDFIFEPKYLVQQKQFFGEFGIQWERVE